MLNSGYQNFIIVLTRLREQATAREVNIGELSKIFQELTVIFQDQILGLTVEGLEPSVSSVFQSTQTEIHRTLRLLGTDLLFLQSSRKQGTTEQRLGIVRDRIDQLMGYCQVIIAQGELTSD